MQAVVLIPAFDRPEMVWLCLDHLAQCPEVRDVAIRVCIDRRDGHAPRSEFAQIHDLHRALDVELRFTPVHKYWGNSYNVLTAYGQAVADGYDWIYLVEDDVLVRPEFFAWHQAVHAREAPAASMGVSDPGHGAFASLGVCMSSHTVERLLPHATPAYFAAPRAYCRQTFPPSPFHCEQDGLWARVLAGQRVVWACPPVVSHVGWYGYHRRRASRPTGTLQHRYDQVRAMLVDPQALARAARPRADVSLAVEPNAGSFSLSTVPGGAV